MRGTYRGDFATMQDALNTAAENLDGALRQVNAAGEQQADGIAQVTQAVEQINGVTQQVAANAEESASAAEEPASQAATLTEMVATFTVSGGAAASRSSKPGKPSAKAPTRRGAPRAAVAAASRLIPLADDGALGGF